MCRGGLRSLEGCAGASVRFEKLQAHATGARADARLGASEGCAAVLASS